MKPRILLVEDDPTSRQFLVATLEAFPAVVDAAATAAAARAHAARHAYALLLVDAHLPDGDGVGLLAALRAQGQQAPAIAHTAAREPVLRDALLAAGFAAVLGKPLTGPALHAAMQSALGAPAPAASGSLRVAEPAPADADAPVWDDAAALSALHGQQAHVDALRALFRDELPAARDAVAAAVAAGDGLALERQLHRLRASCGFVGAGRLAAAVQALQRDPSALPAFLAAAQDTLSSP
jgi:CheY-like chemotaxis protein/HPt (histidine-containing phosphotransfer) domain-containing protein